jgi:hypothetical protein
MSKSNQRVLAPTDPELTNVHQARFPDVPGAVKRGQTARFEIWLDPILGARGKRVAQSVLGACERDYQAISAFFGGIELPQTPICVVIARLPEHQRAYHYGCSGTDIYIDAITVPAPDSRYTQFLLATQVVDLFAAAQGRGWLCDCSHGEALSRVLASALYPNQIQGFATAGAWLNGSRENFIATSETSETNLAWTGCAALFLNYLHSQLGYDWQAIVAAGGPTLSETYHRVTGDATDPFPAFQRLLNWHFPLRHRYRLVGDDPFPISSPSARELPDLISKGDSHPPSAVDRAERHPAEPPHDAPRQNSALLPNDWLGTGEWIEESGAAERVSPQQGPTNEHKAREAALAAGLPPRPRAAQDFVAAVLDERSSLDQELTLLPLTSPASSEKEPALASANSRPSAPRKKSTLVARETDFSSKSARPRDPLAQLLKELHYPTTKAAIMRSALKAKASDATRHAIRSLRQQKFPNLESAQTALKSNDQEHPNPSQKPCQP